MEKNWFWWEVPKYTQYKLMIKIFDTSTDGRTGLNANFPYHRYKKRLSSAPSPGTHSTKKRRYSKKEVANVTIIAHIGYKIL